MNAPGSTKDWLERELKAVQESAGQRRNLAAAASNEFQRSQYTFEMKKLEALAVRLQCALDNLKTAA